VSQDGTFSVIQGEIDGRPLVAMIDVGLRELPTRQGLSFFLGLSTSLINPTSEGLPTRSDTDDLNAWEGIVEARLPEKAIPSQLPAPWFFHFEQISNPPRPQPTLFTMLHRSRTSVYLPWFLKSIRRIRPDSKFEV